ncbi:MAG: DinB family protein [Acidobacteriaceae bacterium]|nr:DinB family protein [Acidobacteriaceae bacterium]
MKRICIPIATFLSVSAVSYGQAVTNPLSTDIKQAYESVKQNLTRAADAVPQEDYSFKPTPEMRSFGQVLEHAATAQARSCNAVSAGESSGPVSAEGKAAVVAALKQSFATCDKAFDALTDADATEMVKLPWGQKTKLGALAGVVTHDTEQYAALSVYMRLKGIVPPSSERKNGR